MTRAGCGRVLLVVAAWALLAARLAGVSAPDFETDGTLIPQLSRVLAMANRGLVFQAAPGETLLLPAYDTGMFAIPSAVVVGLRAVFPEWRADLTLWTYLQFALFAVAVALVALPAVPLRLAAGAVVFLVAHVLGAGDDPLRGILAPHYYGYWAPPLATVVTLVWLLALTLPGRSGGLAKGALTVATGLFVGLLGTWRLDAAGIPVLAALGLAAGLGVRALVARLLLPQGHPERTTIAASRCVMFACLAFVLVTRVPAVALRSALAWHQEKTGIAHFQDSAVRGHLFWHNLYLSYASVPLSGPRAEWDDTVGWNHAAEYDPRLTTAQSAGQLSGDHDRALLALYVTTALEDPLLWLAAFGRRAGEIADLCWPSFVAALAALCVLASMAREGGELALGLPRGRFVLAYQSSAPHAGWLVGPLAAALLLVAAVLPPLCYSTLPWHARAVQLTTRALPWLLALALAERMAHAHEPYLDGAAPRVHRALVRALGRLVALGLTALVLVGGGGLARRRATIARLETLDVDGWAQAWQDSPRRLRVHLPAISTAAIARLGEGLRARHGAVKGGGTVDVREAQAAPAELLFTGWVGGHVVLWMRGRAPWPGKGAMRDQGGWVDVALTGPRPDSFRMRIPRFERGQVFSVLVPVPPSDSTPVDATVSLRTWPAATGGQPVAVVRGLTRTLSW